MKQKTKVVILGLTGSGKTTVVNALRKKGWSILEVDDEVVKRNKGKWPEDEKVINKFFAEINKEVVKLDEVVFVTSFLEKNDIQMFFQSGFKIIEMHADHHELIKRKKRRDNPSSKKLLRFKKNYDYYNKVVYEAGGLISLSIDTTAMPIEEMIKKVENELLT